MKQVGLALKLYAADHGGSYPPTLAPLIPKYAYSEVMLIDPVTKERIVYLGQGRTEAAFPPDEIIAYTPLAEYGSNALFADGHVEHLKPDLLVKALRRKSLKSISVSESGP